MPTASLRSLCCDWLELQANVGLAPRTIEAYARGLAEYLLVCQRDLTDPLTAGRAETDALIPLLGHRSSATTHHYARIAPTTLAKAYALAVL